MDTTLPTAEANAPSRIDEEDIRLTTGFADIFTAILLVVGGTILGSVGGGLGGLAIVAAAFALGKPLVERRRFAACGNVMAIGVAIGAFLPLTSAIGAFALIPAAGASAYYWRAHRVPLALALACIALVGFVVGLGGNLGQVFRNGGAGPSLLGGGVLFAAAMWYDTRDRLRQTRLTDVAFWLHLAAAPLFVHGLFSALEVDPFTATQVNPPVVLASFLVLTLVSLAIDRRPLLASSFIYLVMATATLIRDANAASQLGERELEAAMAPAVIGVLLLGLAAGWTPLRRAVLALLPAVLTDLLAPAARNSPPALDQAADIPEAETEPVRLVLGFNDFFVALGASALFFGAIFIGVQLAIGTIGDTEQWRGEQSLRILLTPAVWFPVAVPALAMWLVAEYFVRIRRMAWPAILSAFAFCFTAWVAGILAAFQFVLMHRSNLFTANRWGWVGPPEPLSGELALQSLAIAVGVMLTANLLFWWRHRLPVSFALAMASLLPLAFADGLVLMLTGSADSLAAINWPVRLLAAGLAVFGMAMAWDRADPARQTQRADTAFWLHLLASGLVIPACFALTVEIQGGALLVAAGFLALIGLALAIDRRAPLVVALPFALGTVGNGFGIGPAGGAGLGLNLALVAALLALVLRWDRARGLLLRWHDRALA